MEVKRFQHGMFGYVTCLPDTRWDNEFVQNVGHALVGLVPLRLAELSGAGQAELQHLAARAAKTIAEKGDIFQYQKTRKRDGWKSSGVLAELATAYAVLALNSPESGVTHLAVHACFWEHEGCPKNADG